MKSSPLLFVGILVALSACAKKPETIDAAYISPTTYSSWNCNQLAAESVRVDNAYATAAGAQNKARENDTLGVIFLGLPVSTLSGGNVAVQIAQLKGHKKTLEQTQIRKGCFKS